MAGGMVGIGRQALGDALRGGMAAAGREQTRVLAWEAQQEAEKQRKREAMMSAAGAGAKIGRQAGQQAVALSEKSRIAREAITSGMEATGKPSLLAGKDSLNVIPGKDQAATVADKLGGISKVGEKGGNAALDNISTRFADQAAKDVVAEGVGSQVASEGAQNVATEVAAKGGEKVAGGLNLGGAAGAGVLGGVMTALQGGDAGDVAKSVGIGAASQVIGNAAGSAVGTALGAGTAAAGTAAGTAAGVGTGVAAGAAAGSVVPVVGTAVGAIAGLLLGKLFG